jgi:uncharacterized peroxidase-related enzyme
MTNTTEPGRSPSFLAVPPATPLAQQIYREDEQAGGYVMNVSQLWAHDPVAMEVLFDLMAHSGRTGSLTFRQRSILVTACSSAFGDSYCSLAWGGKLAQEVGADVAAKVLVGDHDALDPAEQALAGWARQVAQRPGATSLGDVQRLRDAGFDDGQVFAVTMFVALRLAFSTVNDALGAVPDRELADGLPPQVRDAVDFGRPVAD